MTAAARPGALPGFQSREHVLHVVQGEHRITSDPRIVMVTILGSCVAACLRDSRARIGGMNHFLLPGREDEPDQSGAAERQAVHAMELLVNALLSRGASRRHLEAKVFGGACTMRGLADVGSKNAAFATSFLAREGIAVVSECLGGRAGRRVQYWPVEGRARRSFMDYEAPQYEHARVVAPASSGSLELF